MLTSSTQLQNRSFLFVERTRRSAKCRGKGTCKACETFVFHCQICKFVTFLLPSSWWLLKLPIILNQSLKISKSGNFRPLRVKEEDETFKENVEGTKRHYLIFRVLSIEE